MNTKTIFRKYEDGEIIALFTQEPGTSDPCTCSAYVHVGQHTSADPYGVIRQTKPAKPSEYRDLARELRRIGYSLHICQRMNWQADLQARRKQLIPKLEAA